MRGRRKPACFQSGFIRMHDDPQAALGDVGDRARLRSDLAQIGADCGACHDHFR